MTPLRTVVRALLRGLFLRCPHCGRGKIYRTFWSNHDSCGNCGHHFQQDKGEFTGALMLAQGLFGAIVAGGAFWLVFYSDASRETLLWYLAITVLAVPTLLYRNVKGAWIGIIYAVSGPRLTR